jgi:hypothetical protein
VNERAVRSTLARLGERVVMWRGPSLAGTDVDLLVAPGQREAVEEILGEAGLSRDEKGHWASAAGDVLLDLVGAGDWPRAYPAAAGVLGRARREDPELPPVAAPEDRLLIFAADAVAGRPASRLAAKLRPLAGDADVRARAATLARAERGAGLLSIAADPDALEGGARHDALPWRRALAAAARSARARAALATRLRAGAARRARRLAQKSR